MVTVYAGVDHRLKRLAPPGGDTVPSGGTNILDKPTQMEVSGCLPTGITNDILGSVAEAPILPYGRLPIVASDCQNVFDLRGDYYGARAYVSRFRP